MNDLIERYVYDVTRRLPEKDREDVRKELTSNIYDMLSDNADIDEIKTVLYQLGSPSVLAEKYRQNPRYLISPAIYDEYMHILKWVLPFVGIGMLMVGMFVGAIGAIQHGMVDWLYFIENIFTRGISFGVTSVFTALVWITIGFAIAERISTKKDRNKDSTWKIEDLPETLPLAKGRISLADSVTELVMIVFFSVIAILLCIYKVPVPFVVLRNGIRVDNIFSSDFLTDCIPAIVMITLFGVVGCISKIRIRQWTPIVCGIEITSNVVGMCVVLYLLNKPNILSTEFITSMQEASLGNPYFFQFIMPGAGNPLFIFVCVIVILSTLLGCFTAIRKTLKNQQKVYA